MAKDLTEFVGGLSQDGLQFWKTAFSAMTRPGSSPSRGNDLSNLTKDQKEQSSPSPASGQKVILLPCKSAPSRERVQLWLQAKRQFECLQRDRKKRLGAQNVISQDKNKSPHHDELENFLSLSRRQDEASEKVLVLQTLRKNSLILPLSMSPVEAGTSNNSPKEVKCAMEDEIRGQVERDENSFKQTPSPDPSCLPPWQQTSDNIDPDNKKLELGVGSLSPKLGSSIDPLSPESIKPKQFFCLSPFPVKGQDGETLSPSVLHSTPILSKRRNKGAYELDCSPGKEGSHFETVYPESLHQNCLVYPLIYQTT